MERRDLGFRLRQTSEGEFEVIKLAPKVKEKKPCPVGSRLRSTYLAMYDDGQNRRFYKEKDYDIVARVQSFEQHCLLSNILARCQNGDVSALQRVRGQYVDVTGAPMDSRSAHDLLNRSKGVFNALSKEEKARYNDSFKDFVGSFGSSAGIEAFVQARMNAKAAAQPADQPAAQPNVTGGVNNESK